MSFAEVSRANFKQEYSREIKVVATGGGAMSETLTPIDPVACDFRLCQVELHLDGAATTSENFTITLDSGNGAAYDVVLHSVDISGEDDTANVILVANDFAAGFKAGDTIDFAFANTEANTWGLTVTYRV
jgi:hypothetical protein